MSDPVNRRRFLGAAALSGAAVATLGSRAALAQESTPSADATPAEAPSESSRITVNQLGPTATPLGEAVPPEITDPANWSQENVDLSNTRSYLGSSISASNASQLGTSWSHPIIASGSWGALTAQPVIVGDILYVQDTSSNVYAFDKNTGDILWTKEYNKEVASGGPSGVAVAYGYAVFLVGPGSVAAIDAKTGEDRWLIDLTGMRGEGISMAPGIYDSTVYISTIPGGLKEYYNGGQRGIFYALDLSTGSVLWWFDTTTDNLWNNPRANSGGGLWHPPAFDTDGNIYIDIANPGPFPGNAEYPAGSSRPGENLYTDSLVRLNKDTGGVDWYVKVKDYDLFDLDNQASPILAEVDGKLVVFAAGKHGYVLAADANTGEKLWKTAVGEHLNDEITPDELPDDGEEPIEVLPGSTGGIETNIAYANGMVFAPLLNASTLYTKSAIPGGTPISEATGQLVALNASTGEIVWDVTFPSPQLAAATVVNDLVFTAGLDGVVRALNIADGSVVWTYQATAGINAPLAFSGDTLFVSAGGPLMASTDTLDPAPEMVTQVIAVTIGGEVQGAPAGGATPAAGTPEAAGA